MAVLASCAFRRVLSASIGSYMFVFLSFTVANTLSTTAFRGASDFPLALALFPPFAYNRICTLLLSSTFTFDTLSPELASLIGMLTLDVVLYYTLGLYLDAVLPREFGVRSHPLFCLRPLTRLCMRLRQAGAGTARIGMAGSGSAVGGAAVRHCTRVDVDEDEDDDVCAERTRVEEEEKASGGCSSAGGSPNATSPADEEAEEELIVSRSLRKVYSGGKVAVRNLTMSIRRGECFGFLGPNGAGKTTAISVWTGLYEPTSGSATVCGHDIRTEMGLVYGLMGVCPQFDILWPLLTVRETLRFYAQLKGVPKADWDTEAERAAEAVELTRAQERQVVRLSGGMKRRVSFAISLIAAPEVVFLDEPCGSRSRSSNLPLGRCPGLASPCPCLASFPWCAC